MTYIHDFSGRSISHDAYLSLPVSEQMHYHPTLPRRRESLAEDLIDIGIEAAALGIVLGSFADDSSPSDSFLSSPDSDSSSGFDNGFGGGNYSGGGAGGDY